MQSYIKWHVYCYTLGRVNSAIYNAVLAQAYFIIQRWSASYGSVLTPLCGSFFRNSIPRTPDLPYSPRAYVTLRIFFKFFYNINFFYNFSTTILRYVDFKPFLLF